LNYNSRYPSFTFRIDHTLKRKLEKLSVIEKLSTNEFARKIITMYLSNQLVKKSEDLATEKMKLQIEKLKQEIKYMEIKTNYAENFHAPMSRSATVHIKPQVIVETKKTSFEHPQSPYDATNKRLQCVDCGQLWNWYSEKEFNSQMQEFQRHLVNAHNRPSTEIERQVLIELNYEGDSTR
jgi:hypothetical protein